ncbi:lysozyme [Streptomyces millisiae]|uniref:Lysozyme n=1 Tax=Streptomyces millisiae TaxID=3075542 RepID=A0ABU2LJK6_9ACTN|nr:lysozyme [Streptomyces sp. DSM 44918]MDT0317675.1 lysozyme [Streptomyces sp. DSM 44918]
MKSRSSRSRRPRLGRLTLGGVLAATLALLIAPTGTAAAADEPVGEPSTLEVGELRPGQAFMGAGELAHEGGAIAEDSQIITPLAPTDGVQGIDVSRWQGSINWTSVRNAGIQFAWMKATEGTTYRDPNFNTNYPNAYYAGVIRGAYHFALPNSSSGATQANFFASNGGAWSADNLTLPGVLDIESNPYGSQCYGLSTSQMRSWIQDFYNTYKSRTGRDIVIYTSPSWWNTCTGSWSGMASQSPLWVAHWTTANSPTLPGGFSVHTVWQYTSTGSVSGISGNVDRNQFNGSRDRLLALANNTA